MSEEPMSTCTVTYSPDVVKRAVRTYFWRRFVTPWGLLYLLSFPPLIGAICWVYYMQGANWFVGAFGALVAMNLMIQSTYYFLLPKAYAKGVAKMENQNAKIEVSGDGLRISSNRSASFRKWTAFKYVWPYKDFIILVISAMSIRFVFLPTDGMSDEVYDKLLEATRKS